MILLVLLSFVLIAGYVFAMIKKGREIPYSISDTYYALTHKFWFGLCTIGSSLLLLPNIVGACIALIFSQIWVGCNSWYWLLLWGGFIAYMVISMKKYWTGNFISDFIKQKPMFWIEVTSLLTVYLTCVV